MVKRNKSSGIKGVLPRKKLSASHTAKIDTLFAQSTRDHQHGRAVQAEAGYRKILRIDPRHADANQLLGVICIQTQRFDEAVNHLRHAVMQNPGVHFYHLNLGRALKDAGNYSSAEIEIKRSIQLRSTVAESHCLLASLYLDMELFEQGLAVIETALEINPQDSIAWNTQGLLLKELGRTDSAVDSFEQAIACDPNYGAAYNNLGNQYRRLGNLNQSRVYLARAVELLPNFAEAHLNLAHQLRDESRPAEAAFQYHRAIEIAGGINDQSVDWSVLESREHFKSGCVSQAIACLDQALKIKPGVAAVENFRAALLCYHMTDGQSLADQLLQWGAGQTVQAEAPVMAPIKGKIRIGYVSPDFREHAVSDFFKPVIAHHDRQQFEIFCYSSVGRSDTTTEWFKQQADHWRDIASLDGEQAATVVAEDNLHLLVDLAGHTIENRLDLFFHRPAPVQVTYLGYPHGTGLRCINYRISDHFADPVGLTESHYCEQLVRLPHGFFCFEPPKTAAEVTNLPALTNGYITYGSFHNPAKICDRTLRLWSKILAIDESAKLLIQSHVLKDAVARTQFINRFVQHGIGTERLILVAGLPFEEHLEQHSQVDIVLDTLLWNGHTTTCNSLWMGVPHVVRVGDRHSSRMGWSILNNLGLQDWAADTDDGYVDLAIQKSADLDLLVQLRSQLRAKMLASPLTNAQRFAEDLEIAYKQMLSSY